jgi:hypothetical protein
MDFLITMGYFVVHCDGLETAVDFCWTRSRQMESHGRLWCRERTAWEARSWLSSPWKNKCPCLYSLCLSLSLYLSIYLSFFLSYLSISLSISLSLFLSRYLSISLSQLLKAVRTWCVLCMLTSKWTSRHTGVQFCISHLGSWLRACRCSELTCRLSGATRHWKFK